MPTVQYVGQVSIQRHRQVRVHNWHEHKHNERFIADRAQLE